MAIRRMIALLSGGETDAPLLGAAFDLARIHQSRMDGLFIRRSVSTGGDFLGDAFSTYGMEYVLEALEDAAASACLKARSAYETACDHADGNTVGRFVEFVGLPREAMAEEGRVADLVVAPKPAPAGDRSALDAIECAALYSAAPVLALPAGTSLKTPFESAVIGWDGSLEAAHAVDGAMPLLKKAKKVTLVHAGGHASAARRLASLADYLSLHGISAGASAASVEGRTESEALLAEAREEAADLLVMGGFGAPAWKRGLGGGDTNALLSEADFAILLAH